MTPDDRKWLGNEIRVWRGEPGVLNTSKRYQRLIAELEAEAERLKKELADFRDGYKWMKWTDKDARDELAQSQERVRVLTAALESAPAPATWYDDPTYRQWYDTERAQALK